MAQPISHPAENFQFADPVARVAKKVSELFRDVAGYKFQTLQINHHPGYFGGYDLLEFLFQCLQRRPVRQTLYTHVKNILAHGQIYLQLAAFQGGGRSGTIESHQFPFEQGLLERNRVKETPQLTVIWAGLFFKMA